MAKTTSQSVADLRASLLSGGKHTSVPIEGVDQPVYLKPLSAAGRGQFTTALEEKGTIGAQCLLATLTLCDEQGVRLFKDSEVEQVASFSATVLDAITKHALEMSGLGKNATDDTKSTAG